MSVLSASKEITEDYQKSRIKQILEEDIFNERNIDGSYVWEEYFAKDVKPDLDGAIRILEIKLGSVKY